MSIGRNAICFYDIGKLSYIQARKSAIYMYRLQLVCILVFVMAKESFAERKERVFQAYKECHDFNVAMICCGITDPLEQEKLNQDAVLSMRIVIEDAEYKRTLHGKLETLSNSADKDGVRLNALDKLLKAHYPERFKEKVEVSGQMEWVIKPRIPIKESAPRKKGK